MAARPDAVRLRFSLPLPPSVNHCYRRVTKGGRRMNILTSSAKRWYDGAQTIATAVAKEAGWVRPDGCKVVMEYTLYWPDRRRRDPNNVLKVLCDALECITGDDRWVLPRCMDFFYDKGDPRVELCIYRKD